LDYETKLYEPTQIELILFDAQFVHKNAVKQMGMYRREIKNMGYCPQISRAIRKYSEMLSADFADERRFFFRPLQAAFSTTSQIPQMDVEKKCLICVHPRNLRMLSFTCKQKGRQRSRPFTQLTYP